MIRRISIDDRFLDEVQTRLETKSATGSISYISAPVERHQALEDEEGVTLTVPVLTALQLSHDGTLPVDHQQSVQLSIAGRNLDSMYLQWLRCVPGHEFGGSVLLRFARKPGVKEKPYDPKAWLKTLVPLKLYPKGKWNPAVEYWGEEGEPIEAWAKPIIKHGPRPMFEMEQVLPGSDPEDFDSDPILEAAELKNRGKIARAKKLLEKLIIQDIRCLDAHAHLGNFVFDKDVRAALEHYHRGVLIGELSLDETFDGVLPWGMIDNRPFLRCLNGLGLCLWRLARVEEAERLFERCLWMCPSDNMGVRFLLPPIRAGHPWTDDAR